MKLNCRSILWTLALLPLSLIAEDGYRLWMGYDTLEPQAVRRLSPHLTALCAPGASEIQRSTRREILKAIPALLDTDFPEIDAVTQDGVVVVGTPESSPTIARLELADELAGIGPSGFLIRSTEVEGHPVTVIAAPDDQGALYGAFAFLRHLQNGHPLDALSLKERPRFQLRLLNHWDNLDGTIERGYAGSSLWPWAELPDEVAPRLTDYARANASVGLNGTVLNNVNASSRSLTPEYLEKAAAIAGVLRPYGIRVFLSARFSSPIELGGLDTADPADPRVLAWWEKKVSEIYSFIPDFGGFLVKANSEGQPGPLTYGRTHADGANMLAAALRPHGGIVMWRAFVYDPAPGSDRIAQAYDAMKPLDGEFAPNVIVQVKNGPLDFQPREPFHPLFGGMAKSQIMPELQITQEYLGHSRQLAYLAPMWEEFFNADTFAQGKGSTVAETVDGSLFPQKLTAIAGVANTGSDRNWTGHPLAQSNWYAFGRLAWNPDLDPESIAREWITMTLTRDETAVATLAELLMESHEAVVNYSMPLGLHHLMWEGHHYGPQPWCDHLPRADWNPTYFHRAAADGIGFDRTKSGSNAVAQYHPEVRARFSDPSTCPDAYLLWFHHLPWDFKMKSGKALWDELCLHYQQGVDWMGEARDQWSSVKDQIHPDIHAEVGRRLAIQQRDAIRWRDACLLYFQTFSGLPFPSQVGPVVTPLAETRTIDPLESDR